eukprot:CAMPEP_0180422160 /NCGR_PEP_ID=MMETSP1036_2-20121128/3533_1 /TAXON_ID=632150 /ORGANISM="Azadinium spinosum, Strain 3D9" /LENGTH=571 /DNA_ID=CAMNT_0022427467 /DNA_START=57 /DNA_END=1772 /DNA_ORIENTATION=+
MEMLTRGDLEATLSMELECLRCRLTEDFASIVKDIAQKQHKLGVATHWVEGPASLESTLRSDACFRCPPKPQIEECNGGEDESTGSGDFELPGMPSPMHLAANPAVEKLAHQVTAVEDEFPDAQGDGTRSSGFGSYMLPDWSMLGRFLAISRSEAAKEAQKAMGLTPPNTRRRDDFESFSASQRYAVRLVQSNHFEMFSMLLIICYGIQVGLQTDHQAQQLDENTPLGYRMAEIIFLGFFLIELCLRIFAHRCRFFRMWGWGWNLFDLATVLLQVIEEVVLLVWSGTTSAKLPGTAILRMVRIFRAVRVVRVLRMMEFLSDLRLLVTCIVASMRSFYWVMVLLVMMVYVVSIYFTQIVLSYRVDLLPESQAYDDLTMWYGSLTRTSLSVFQGLTGGVDWNDLVAPLVDHVSPWTGLLFVAWTAFGILAVMNIVTGTFVENAIEANERIKEVHKMDQAKKVFHSLDLDSSGCINYSEIQDQLGTPEVQNYFKAIGVTTSHVELLFQLLDTSDSGTIDFVEFLTGCHRLQAPAKAIDVMLIMREMTHMLGQQTTVLKALKRQLSSRDRAAAVS